MTRLIIGFGNKKQRGKDTASDICLEYLKKEYNIVARKDKFTTSLKEIAKVAFGFSDDQMTNHKEERDPYWQFTPRWALQKLGTECFRNHIDQDFWVKTLVRRAQENLDTPIVISDVRFFNEAMAVRDLGGHLIQVNRVMPPSKHKDYHLSEIDLDGFNWDYEINNNGTVDELKMLVHNVVDDIIRKYHGR